MNEALAMDQALLTVADVDDPADDVAGVGEQFLRCFAWPAKLDARAGAGWLSEVVRQLHAIEQLPNNWDGSGGVSIEPQTVVAARSLIELVVANASKMDKPHISPTPAGGVQFDWDSGGRYLEIEVTDPKSARYFFEDRDGNCEAEGTILLGEPINQFVSYLRRVEKTH